MNISHKFLTKITFVNLQYGNTNSKDALYSKPDFCYTKINLSQKYILNI